MKLAGSETVRSPEPRSRIQSFNHAAVGRPVGSIWILRYSVSVVAPGRTDSIGRWVGLAAGEGDVVPPGDSVPPGEGDAEASPLGEAVAPGDEVGEGDCDRAASGR